MMMMLLVVHSSSLQISKMRKINILVWLRVGLCVGERRGLKGEWKWVCVCVGGCTRVGGLLLVWEQEKKVKGGQAEYAGCY